MHPHHLNNVLCMKPQPLIYWDISVTISTISYLMSLEGGWTYQWLIYHPPSNWNTKIKIYMHSNFLSSSESIIIGHKSSLFPPVPAQTHIHTFIISRMEIYPNSNLIPSSANSQPAQTPQPMVWCDAHCLLLNPWKMQGMIFWCRLLYPLIGKR